MVATQCKFSQPVFAEMTRFCDESGRWYLDDNHQCYLVRNKTRVEFGRSDHLIGTVIMTNPGSYGLDKVAGWEEFRSGQGHIHKLAGYGSPDLTMQNLIMVIQEGFRISGQTMPQGFINILNVSNVVCPKGNNAEKYHYELKEFIVRHHLDISLLESTSKEHLEQVFEESPFVILGFVQGAFARHIKEVLITAQDFPQKTVSVLDQKGWPSHPRRWRTEIKLREKAIAAMAEVI